MKKSWIFVILLISIEAYLVLTGIGNIKHGMSIVEGILLLILALFIFLLVVINYNKIIKQKNKVKESFSLIDVQLKLRFDLIPNLVTIVKKYAKHEKEVLTEVTKLRKLAVECEDEQERLDYANKLVPQMKNLIAIAEGYPELTSQRLFKSLMEQISDTEDRIAASRRIYDSNVTKYNTTIESFPCNVIAFIFDQKRETLFRIDVGENIMPKIDLGDK